MLDQPEQMQRLCVTRINCQNVAAEPFRVGGPPSLMIGERGIEPRGGRRRRACLTKLCADPGTGAALLSVHLGLIAQPGDTYPLQPGNQAGRTMMAEACARKTLQRLLWSGALVLIL